MVQLTRFGIAYLQLQMISIKNDDSDLYWPFADIGFGDALIGLWKGSTITAATTTRARTKTSHVTFQAKNDVENVENEKSEKAESKNYSPF